MLLHCPRVLASFPGAKVRLEHQGPAWMLWAEHGGSMILKVGDLKAVEPAAEGQESGIFLELDLLPPEKLIHEIEEFAAEHNLPLGNPPLIGECRLTPILAACHVPARHLFIFAEESELLVRSRVPGTVEIAVAGDFKARSLPSKETDLVIQLAPADLARLLSYLLAQARAAAHTGLPSTNRVRGHPRIPPRRPQ